LDKWRRGRAPTRADRPIDAEARSLADSPGPLSRALVSARAAAPHGLPGATPAPPP